MGCVIIPSCLVKNTLQDMQLTRWESWKKPPPVQWQKSECITPVRLSTWDCVNCCAMGCRYTTTLLFFSAYLMLTLLFSVHVWQLGPYCHISVLRACVLGLCTFFIFPPAMPEVNLRPGVLTTGELYCVARFLSEPFLSLCLFLFYIILS